MFGENPFAELTALAEMLSLLKGRLVTIYFMHILF